MHLILWIDQLERIIWSPISIWIYLTRQCEWGVSWDLIYDVEFE